METALQTDDLYAACNGYEPANGLVGALDRFASEEAEFSNDLPDLLSAMIPGEEESEALEADADTLVRDAT